MSNGQFLKSFENQKNVKEIFKDLEETQRKMSHKQECWKKINSRKKLKKGEIFSKQYERLKKKLQKLHLKLRNIRKEMLHQASYFLVKEYDVICIEDLKLKKMTESNKGTVENPGKNVGNKSSMNKRLLDNGLGMFFSMLRYKCEWYEKELREVPPYYTSQKCSNCGYTSKDNRNGEKFYCEKCTFKSHADKNAAINILEAGLKLAA